METRERMERRNEMSAAQLVISQNSELQFVENPNTGKLFFVCGSKKGYCSPAVVEGYQTLGLDQMRYCECRKPGSDGEFVPCLMTIGNSDANVRRRLGAELLH